MHVIFSHFDVRAGLPKPGTLFAQPMRYGVFLNDRAHGNITLRSASDAPLESA